MRALCSAGVRRVGATGIFQRERTNFREPGDRRDALGTVDLLVQPFLGLVLGIVTLGAMCTQPGVGHRQKQLLDDPGTPNRAPFPSSKGSWPPPLAMRAGGHYILCM